MNRLVFLVFLLVSVFAFLFIKAAYVPVPVTGFNHDVVANGVGPATTSTTADVDGANYAFLAPDFVAVAGGSLPARSLPATGLVTSLTTSGVTWQLADYNNNNALRLTSGTPSGELVFATPQAAGEIFLLATVGSGPGSATFRVNFTDNTSQLFTGISIPNWYSGANTAIQGIGRVNVVNNNLEEMSNSSNPRIYEVKLVLDGANLQKNIQSISIERLSGGAVVVMGVNVNTTCETPSAQPASLVLNAVSSGRIDGSFTAASPAPDQYLVVRYPSGATPVSPATGVIYTPGAALGTGTVVYAGAGTAFSATTLTAATTYDFYVYALNATGCIGPVYRTSAPLSGSASTPACSGLSGVIPVGPTGTYPTLTAALAGISTGVTSSVVLELQSNYTSTSETFPITISYNACLSPTRTLTIRPAAGANGLAVTGNNAGPAIDFNGARYVIIDGTPGGTTGTPSMAVNPSGTLNPVRLNIRNTNTAGVAIRLDNGSSHNRIRYCDIQGQNNTGANVPNGMAGVVYVGNTGIGGNDRDTIDHCNIHGTTATDLPSIGIYVLGTDNNGYTADFNEQGVVSNCNIYDFFLPGGNSVGIELNHGVHAWRITGNNFFQTTPRSFSSGGYNRAIWAIPSRNTPSVGNGFVITDNYIGGSAPQCGGSPYTLSNQAHLFSGIRLEVKDGTTPSPSVVRNNTITNIALTTTTTGDAFNGISIHSSGSVDIEGNTIGGTSGNGLISINGGDKSHTLGILLGNGSGGTPVFNVRKNVIGGITLSGTGNHFSGIFVNNAGEYFIDSNVIGSATTANSIHASSASGSRFVRGISVPSGSPRVSVTNNTVANLTNNSTSTTGGDNHVAGIRLAATSATVVSVNDNAIHNLISDSRGTNGSTDAAVLGIGINATTANAISVSRNHIHSLVSNAPSQGVYLEGIFFIGNNSDNVINTLDGNFIHSFDVTDVLNTSANIRGLEPSSGSVLVTNNMVRLGIRPDGTSLTNAMQIWGIARGSARRHYYFHNSVYIGGTGVGSTTGRHTSAFRNEGSGPDSVLNNILVNERMNASGGSNHFSVWMNSSSGVVYSHNVYRYGSGSGENNLASVSSNGTSGITPAYVPGWLAGDMTSWDMDPQYANPDGAVAQVDLHIRPGVSTPAEGTGLLIAAVTQDIDGQTRSAFTPVDIGADAGNFTALPSCVAPAAPTALQFSNVTRTQIEGTFTPPAGGSDGYIIVIYPGGATPVAPSDGSYYQPGTTLGTGTILAVGTGTAFTAPGLNPGTLYDFRVYAFRRYCIGGPRYSIALLGSQATVSCGGVSGVIPVGPAGTYPTLTAALNGISGGTGGPVVLELQSNYTDAGETFPILIGNNVCFTATSPLTIRPAAGANGLSITGTNAGPAIDFDSVRYVIIDGTPGGTTGTPPMPVNPSGTLNPVYLNIRNTNTGGVAIRMNRAASNNRISYCDIQGQNNTGANVPTGMAGVVYIGNTGVGGNDRDTIDHCNIHAPASTNLPSIGVYVLGPDNNGYTENFNEQGVISNCNIYDFFLAGGNSAGVELNHGVQAWHITGNSFFQAAPRSFTSGGYNRPVWIISARNSSSVGNGFVVTGNYIGGSEPQCGGDPYTLSNQGNSFCGIRLEARDGTTPFPSVIRNNTITNFSQTTTTTTAIYPFNGISSHASGSVDIEGNTIGGTTGNALISVASGTNGETVGILMEGGVSGNVFNIRKNVIGGITATNNGNRIWGMRLNNAGDFLIDSNIIGSTTTTNSLYASNTGTGATWVRGIGLSSGSPRLWITNNTIANLTNNATGTGGGSNHVAGIRIADNNATVFTIDGNTIRNLVSDTRGTSGGTDAAVLGIGMSSTLANAVSVSRNVIHTLVSNAPSQGVYIEGIFFIGNGSDNVINVLDGNFIHSFDVTDASNTNANMRGLEANGGSCLVTNNMVRLGIRPDGTPLTNAMQVWGMARGSSRRHYYFHNSVYIGGTGVGITTGRHTSAFRNEGTGPDSVINNILVNNRTNASGGSNHFSVWINSSSGAAYGHNIYRYGSGSAENNLASVSSNGTSGITAAYVPGWINSDTTSLTDDPLYINPEGSVSAVDLHIQPGVLSPVEAAGLPIPYVTEDFDGEDRAILSPADIGADAGNFLQLSVTITANNSPVCGSDTIRITASASVPSATINWTGPNNFTATGTTITIPNADPVHAGTYQAWATLGSITSDTVDSAVVISGSVTPLVSISANPGTSICSGIPVTFIAAPTAGGTSPAYQWRKNGTPVGTGVSYTDNGLAHNDVVTCRMTSSATCAIPDTALSNALTMTVTSSVTPSVSISANPGTSICSGTSVIFTPAPVNGGTAPVYQWRKNGVPVSTGPTYTDNTLTNGQVIICRMISNATCAIPDSALSNALTMAVTPSVTPSVSISANPGISICAGTSVTFTPAPGNGGTAPVYQWRKNGVALGAGTTYTDNSLAQGDVITCRMTSNATCAIPDSALSNLLSMTVTPLVTPAVSVQSDKGTTICQGDVVSFTATPVNGGGTPAYQWYKNTIPVGVNSNIYTDNGLVQGDVIACRLRSSLACVVTDTVLSAAVTMQVISYATSITPSGPVDICEGAQVTLQANTPAMQYQWRRYGVVISGATGRSYNATQTGDYTVTISAGSCALTTDDAVSVAVHAIPVPDVIVSRDTLTTDDYYASYQWYVNGESVPGATSYRYIATQAGLYYVVITDSNGCTANSAFYTIDGVHVPALSARAGAVQIYPNPVRDVLYIRSPFPVQVSVQAADGRRIGVPETADGIRMGDLPDGIYMISVRDMNGIMIRQEKLVKLNR